MLWLSLATPGWLGTQRPELEVGRVANLEGGSLAILRAAGEWREDSGCRCSASNNRSRSSEKSGPPAASHPIPSRVCVRVCASASQLVDRPN